MEKPFTIRLAQESDHDAVFNLLGADTTGIPADDSRHPLNLTDTIMQAHRDPEGKSRCWLAVIGDQPVGIITTRDLGGGVEVREDFKRQGIGSALLKTREDFFKAQMGMDEARAPIRADNNASLRMHFNQGYKLEEASQKLVDENPNLPGHTVLYVSKKLGNATP